MHLEPKHTFPSLLGSFNIQGSKIVCFLIQKTSLVSTKNDTWIRLHDYFLHTYIKYHYNPSAKLQASLRILMITSYHENNCKLYSS